MCPDVYRNRFLNDYWRKMFNQRMEVYNKGKEVTSFSVRAGEWI